MNDTGIGTSNAFQGGPAREMHLSRGTEDGLARTPLEGFFFGWLAMVPMVVGALLGALLPGRAGRGVAMATRLWGGGLLCFLSGVHRGYSFREKGGPLPGEIGGMLAIFAPGMLSLLVPFRRLSLLMLTAGYAATAAIDTQSARRGEAPRFFARLRPVQMAVPVTAFGALFWRYRRSSGNGPRPTRP